MILSLDPEDFDPAFTHQPESSDNIGAWYRTGWRDAYMRYTEGAYTLSDLYERARTTHHMGLPALVHGDGMRFDGSYQYHHILSDPNHNKEIARQITELVEKINTGRTIHFGQATSPQTLQKLADLLVLCKAHNIYVVGFLPPFPHEMYEAMMSKDDAYSDTIKTLPKKLEQLFVAQGYGFYNFTDSALVGGKDYEYTDAGHGSDKLYARMSLYLAQHDPVLRLRIHSDVLKKMIAASTGAAL